MTRYDQIEALLQLYYDGVSSPEDELRLYLLLLDEPEGSAYARERKFIEAIVLNATGQDTIAPAPVEQDSAPPAAQESKGTFRFFSRTQRIVAKYAVAATLVGIVALITTRLSLHKSEEMLPTTTQSSHVDRGVSHINGVPISQEEADFYTYRAVEALVRCYEAQSQGREQINHAFSSMQEELNRSFFSNMPQSDGFIRVSQ